MGLVRESLGLLQILVLSLLKIHVLVFGSSVL